MATKYINPFKNKPDRLTILSSGKPKPIKENIIETYLCEKVKYISVDAEALKFDPKWFVGMTDRLIFFPRGLFYCVETKKPKGGILSKIQIQRHAWLKRLGFRVRVIYTKDQVDEFIKEVTDKIGTIKRLHNVHS